MNNILLMPFIDESESFTKGFECGQLWEIIKAGNTLDKYLCHDSNTKQIEMMCDLFNCDYIIEKVSNDWIYLTIKSTIV